MFPSMSNAGSTADVDDTGEPVEHPLAHHPPREPGFLRRVRTFESIFEVSAFRWYLASMTGNWSAMQMHMIARGFLTYQITGSYAALGTVELANTGSRLIFALTGGVVADRSNRRTIAQVGQMVNAVIAAGIAALLFLDMLAFGHLVIAAVLQAIANSFALQARQAMIPQIVGMKRLTNALALNVSMMSTLRLGAPALAGFLIAVTGASWVFTLMAILYVVATLAMFKVTLISQSELLEVDSGRTPEDVSRVTPSRRNAIGDIRDALVYLWRIPVLRMLLIVDMFLGMLTFPYQRLLPGFVSDVLADNPDETAIRMGILLTITGLGALGGSLVVASLPSRNRGKMVIVSVALFGLALLGFSASTVFVVSAGIVLFMG
ncbi:MAG: MFS transporter, partial [Chloroflexi bacterium]|nr:MFS transporter [Chloroflexota bacterium]